jgi:hypothetical protein
VLPLLAHDLVDDELTELMCQVSDVSMRMYSRCRASHFTQADLEELDDCLIDMCKTMKEVYEDTNVGTRKMHKNVHLTSDIKRIGHPKNFNSDLFEAAHTPLKILYRSVVCVWLCAWVWCGECVQVLSVCCHVGVGPGVTLSRILHGVCGCGCVLVCGKCLHTQL